jgi:hypothetical protein
MKAMTAGTSRPRRGFGKALAVRALAVLAGAAFAPAILAAPAHAASGDLVGGVTFAQDCSSGIGVGITFDGSALWYTCFASSPDLIRADAHTGAVIATYNIDNGLGALAYDAGSNGLWIGPGGDFGKVWFVQLDGAKNVTSSHVAFDAGGNADDLDDGLAFDATDNTLYISPDGSTTIHHYKTDGTLLGDSGWAGSGCYNSGLALGGHLLFQGSDGCNHVWVTDKSSPSGPVVFDFDTAVAGDPNFRDEGLTCDPVTFGATQVMWSKEAYSPMRAHAFEIPSGTCGAGGQPPPQVDPPLTAACAAPGTATQSYAGPVATFTDADPNGKVADFTATVDWGDASNSAGTVTGPNGGPFTVAGSHTYAATGPVTITITINDVGGASAVASCHLLVYAFAPGGGSFVIGDRNSAGGTSVTFWGAEWWKLNSLSAGPAPASFKGFASSPAAPACGVGWSTAPGNSPPPPAGPLPAYLGVIVSSSIAQSGSTIGGDTPHLVVVKTNAGYDGNPGHAGTGTVVAQVC